MSLPHQMERSELVDVRLRNVASELEYKGYALLTPDGLIGHDDLAALAVMRLSMLVACDSVWFPKDFQQSALSVAEYTYAYAMNKTIVIDPDRRLLD